MICAALNAQSRPIDHNAAGWYQYIGEHPLKGKWGAHLEMQVRRLDVVTKWQQMFFRPRHHVPGQFELVSPRRLWVFHGPGPTAIFRPAFTAPNTASGSRPLTSISWASWISPTASALRIAGFPSARPCPAAASASSVGASRTASATWPRPSSPLKGGTGVALWDEILFNVPPNTGYSGYDHNRAFIGISQRLSRNNRIEFGYMNQALLQRSGRAFEHNHTLVLSWFCSVPFVKR